MDANALHTNTKGHLVFGGCDLAELAKKHGTPLYVMNEPLIRMNMRRFSQGLKSRYPRSRVAYAGKAFMTGWICNLASEEGLYLDVVSGGELYTALASGFPPGRILFHGNNKSTDEITMGLQARVGRFVVDNYYELETLATIARHMGVKANILLRVAPGIEAHTHEYVETGMLDSKFGFGLSNGEAMNAVKRALELDSLVLWGIHCHIGSQILSLEGPTLAAERMTDFLAQIRTETGVELGELDLGGGLGVAYTGADVPPTIEDYLDTITDAVTSACLESGVKQPVIYLEPGRSIVGDAGLTLYTAGSIKEIPGIRKYVAVDGGMADNPRPALYGSVYSGAIVNRLSDEEPETVCLAGKCCESGDILIKELTLPPIRSGDIIAVFTTGAYNYSMSSNYNRLPRPAVVAVGDGHDKVVVRRESYRDLIARDVFSQGRKAAPITVQSQVAATGDDDCDSN